MDYGRDPREDYTAMVERVTLWDVGAERQCELRGPDALALADYLSPRRLDDLAVGGCRYTMPLRPARARAWPRRSRCGRSTTWCGSRTRASTSTCGRTALALARGADVEV